MDVDENDFTISDEVEDFDLTEYWRPVRRHKWGILSIILISLIAGLLRAWTATPMYKADVSLRAEPKPPRISSQSTQSSAVLVTFFYKTQFEIIRSRAIMEKVIDQLGLVKKLQQERASKLEREDGFLQSVREWKERLDWTKWYLPAQSDASRKDNDERLVRGQLIEQIQAGLTTERSRGSEIITIGFESPDPMKAAKISNAIGDAYIEFGLEARSSGVSQDMEWLNDQLSQLRQKITASTAEIQSLQQKQGILDSENLRQVANQRLSALAVSLIDAQTERQDKRISYEQVKHFLKQEKDIDSIPGVINDAGIRRLKDEKVALNRRMRGLAERYGDKHPKIIAIHIELREVERVFREEVGKLVESMGKDNQNALVRERVIEASIQQQKQEIRAFRQANAELVLKETERDKNIQLYDQYQARLREAELVGGYDVSNIRIIDSALPPLTPYTSQTKCGSFLFRGYWDLYWVICLLLSGKNWITPSKHPTV